MYWDASYWDMVQLDWPDPVGDRKRTWMGWDITMSFRTGYHHCGGPPKTPMLFEYPENQFKELVNPDWISF